MQILNPRPHHTLQLTENRSGGGVCGKGWEVWLPQEEPWDLEAAGRVKGCWLCIYLLCMVTPTENRAMGWENTTSQPHANRVGTA